MKTKQFSICQDCIHVKTCVLTAHKDKVWTCSEYQNINMPQEADEPLIEKIARDKNNVVKVELEMIY